MVQTQAKGLTVLLTDGSTIQFLVSKRSVHKRDVHIEVNISVTLLRHTHGTERECWCINATTAAKELIYTQST
jgi:hypothetical protein